MFKVADYIGCPTEGNIDFICKEYPWMRREIFKVFDFWSRYVKIEKSDEVRRKLGLSNKFIAVYGGSVGPAQKLEHLVDLAYACQGENDIIILVLGKGSQFDKIRDLAMTRKVNNMLFLPFLPQNDYLQLLSSCNAGFIVLNEKHATPNFPSKTLSYFNLQIPILASIDYVTDYGEFLEKTGTGLWSYSGNVNTFKKNLLKLYCNPQICENIKKKQLEYFNEHMQPHHAYEAIINHINGK